MLPNPGSTLRSATRSSKPVSGAMKGGRSQSYRNSTGPSTFDADRLPNALPRPREPHLPVGFPGRAVVFEEGLAPFTGGRGDGGPEEADLDRLALEDVVADEFPAAVFEPAVNRRIYVRVAGVQPPDRPAAQGGVEPADGDGGVGALRQIDGVVVHV